MKIKSIFIENFKIFKNFKIDFTNENVINPITILSGVNGSGKTSLFEFIFEILQNKNISKDNSNSYVVLEDESKLPIVVDSEYLQNKDVNEYKEISNKLYYFKAKDEFVSAKKLITDYIDKLIYELDVKSSEVYQNVRNTINELLATLKLQIEFSKLDKEKEIYFKNNLSNEIKISDLSSGEKEIITKILPLFISPVQNSIILIDEPESSLHPNWQNEIINLYQLVAQKYNNQMMYI